MFEFCVKQIGRTDGDQTVTLGQTVANCGIHCPQIIFAGLKSSSCYTLKNTALIDVRRFQRRLVVNGRTWGFVRFAPPPQALLFVAVGVRKILAGLNFQTT